MATTWNEAASEAAEEMGLKSGYGFRGAALDRPKALAHAERCLGAAVEDFPHIDVAAVPVYLTMAARGAVSYLAGLQPAYAADWIVAAAHEDVVDRILELVISRQRKYGTGNILKFGQVGIAVRAHDKLARLENGSMDFEDEKEIDAWEDIVGYAILSHMLEAGTFELALAPASKLPPADAVVTNFGKITPEHDRPSTLEEDVRDLRLLVGDHDDRLLRLEQRQRPLIRADHLKDVLIEGDVDIDVRQFTNVTIKGHDRPAVIGQT